VIPKTNQLKHRSSAPTCLLPVVLALTTWIQVMLTHVGQGFTHRVKTRSLRCQTSSKMGQWAAVNNAQIYLI